MHSKTVSKKVAQAKKLFTDFSGHELDGVEYEIGVPDGLVVFPFGRLDGVMYTTTRDGKKEKYMHQFKVSSAPILCATSDGKQLFIVGGNYKFTNAGIRDL